MFQAVTEAASVVLQVERASIWSFSPGSRSIVCEDMFLRRRGHATGEILRAEQYPRYLDALASQRAVAVDDALTDERTADLADYLRRNEVVSLLDVPIWRDGKVVGILCSEHTEEPRHWGSEDETFAASLADIASISMQASDRYLAEQHLREVLNAVTEAVFTIDQRETVHAENSTAQRFITRIGSDRWEDAVRGIEIINVENEPVPREEWPAQRAFRGETVTGAVLGWKYRQGSRLTFARIHAAPIYAGGRVRDVVTVVTDVSREVHLERLKRDLLGALAHELKTPAAITKGYAQYMARASDVPAKWRPMLAAIDRAADRMDQLVSVLLAASSIMLGRLVLAHRPFDLTKVLKEVVEHVRPAHSNYDIVLDAPQAIVIVGDAPRVRQTIEQLVGNAIRYSPNGGPIHVVARLAGSSVVISVRDRGIGIPVSDYNAIFTPYRRARHGIRHSEGGLGIGLYFCREIARGHRGDVWFESAEGAGTTFFLRLPVAEVGS